MFTAVELFEPIFQLREQTVRERERERGTVREREREREMMMKAIYESSCC